MYSSLKRYILNCNLDKLECTVLHFYTAQNSFFAIWYVHSPIFVHPKTAFLLFAMYALGFRTA